MELIPAGITFRFASIPITKVASFINSLTLPHTELLLSSEGILEIRLGANFYYTMSEAVEISNAIDEVSLGHKRKVVLIAGAYSNCDVETRKFISSDEICKKITSMALVPNSLAQDLLARFIVNFDRPSVPAKVFRTREKALTWLKS